MTDLSTLVPSKETLEIALVHPGTGEVLKNDDGSDMTITVYGPWTKEYRGQGFKKANERLKAKKNPREFDFSFEELEEANIDLLASVTTEWNITYDGEKPKLNQKKAKEIYNKVFWIKGQLEEAINNSVDFTNL